MESRASRDASLWARACQLVVGGLIAIALSAAAAELIARHVLGLSPLVYTRPPHPVLVTADQASPARLEGLRDAPGGPGSLGYRPDGLSFQADPDAPPPASMTTFSDFLFDHALSRYSADDVDRLLCDDPDASALFVLGASGAQGFAATVKLRAWHALLEEALRRQLRKPNLYVFNAAMGGYGGFQDKLAYHLAVAPRVPAPVLLYNGGNDLQAISASRPGDPAFLGTWYGTVYGDRLLLWLAERSAIVNTVLQNRLGGSFIDLVARLGRDDGFFARRAAASIDLYLESMSEILAACEAGRRPCWVAIQPSRALAGAHGDAHGGGATPDDASARRMRQSHDMLMQRLASHRYRERFIDLAGLFDGGDGERYFADPVHVTDDGQPLIAEALAGRIAASLTGPLPRGRAADRCAALPRPRLLATVPLDRLAADGVGRIAHFDGGVSVHAGTRQWAYAARAPIALDPAWPRHGLVVRVRFAVTEGDIAVALFDQETSKEVSPERPFKAGDGDATAYLPIRGQPRRIFVVFKKTLPDDVRSEAIVHEISVLAR